MNTLEKMMNEEKELRPALYDSGFDPLKYIRLSTDGEVPEIRLDIKYRMAWFRLVYPEGAVRSDLLEKTENKVTVRVRLYKNNMDPLENSISEAICERSLEDQIGDGEEYKKYYVDLAETYAKGRALSNLGFDFLLPPNLDHVTLYDEMNGIFASQNDRKARSLETEEPLPMSTTSTSSAPIEEKPKEMSVSKNSSTPKTPSEKVILIDGVSIPVDYENAKSCLTLELAKQTPGVGVYKDRTLGEMALEDPKFLDWVSQKCTDYKKAAAELLIQTAVSA